MQNAQRILGTFLLIASLSLPAVGQLDIVTTSLPDGTEMVPYSVQLDATNGTPPYLWEVVTGFIEKEQPNSHSLTGVARGWHADDNSWTVTLPFDFPFYGKSRSTVHINSNGTLTFDGSFSDYSANLSTFKGREMVAALWDDLSTYSPDDVYVSQLPDQVTIRWACHYLSGPVVNVSVVLHLNGTILITYGSGNTYGGMIGVSAGDGQNYVMSARSQAGSMDNASDILFTPIVSDLPEGLSLGTDGLLSGTPQSAGTNLVTVAVEDDFGAMTNATFELVILENPNQPPEITDRFPPESQLVVPEETNGTFSVVATDPEGSNLVYRWEMDGVEVGSDAASFPISTFWGDAGMYEIRVFVSDGLWTNVSATWMVEVSRDNDDDGIPNAYENAVAVLDPWFQGDAILDDDGDFLINLREFHAGTICTNADTDGDSLPDGWEVEYGSNPLTPTGGVEELDFDELVEWSLNDWNYNLDDLVVTESNAFLVGEYYMDSGSTGVLIVVDISNPEAPQQVGFTYLPSPARAIALTGDVAYVAFSSWPSNGVGVVDCSLPSSPTLLGIADSGSYVYDLCLGESALFSARSWDGVASYDISSLASPALSSSLSTAYRARTVACHDSQLFSVLSEYDSDIDDYVSSMEAFDVISGTGLVWRGSTDLLGSYEYSSVSAPGLVFAVGGWDSRGVTVVDVSNPDAPAVSGVYGTEAMSGCTVQSNYLYAAGDDRLSVWHVEVGGDLRPVYKASGWGGRAVQVRGNHAFVLLSGGLAIFQNQGLIDTDQDGLRDPWELQYWGDLGQGRFGDPDGDGIFNIGEHDAELDPTDDDQDDDTLRDGDETQIHNTDPDNHDTDWDGLEDDEEVVPGEDGFVTDPIDGDTDLDFVWDEHELLLDRSPTIQEPSYHVLFYDDMEAGGTNWQASGSWSLAHDDYESGFTSWTDSPWTNMAVVDNQSSLALVQGLDLTGYRHAWLEYNHRLDKGWDDDALIDVSVDGGQSWTLLTSAWSYSDGMWQRARGIGMSRYCGYSDVRVRFRLQSRDWEDMPHDGWHVDDVLVRASDCIVTGMVAGAGVPLAMADVVLRPRGAEVGRNERRVLSDESGHYVADMLVPGNYVIKADHDHFAAEFHMDAMHRDAATPLPLVLGGTETVNFELEYGASPAYLMVTSTPVNAQVYVDFASTGQQTPVLLTDVDVGSHFVSVRLPGYPEPMPIHLAVSEGETTRVEFNFDGPTGAIRVESFPETNAVVYLNFEPTGQQTPCIVTNLLADIAVGSRPFHSGHFISVSKSGFASPAPRQVEAVEGWTNLVVFTLPIEALGDLEVSSSPTGAVVWLDYVNTGEMTDALLQGVPVASHTISVNLPGFLSPVPRGIRVSSGQVSRVHFNLHVADDTDDDEDGLPDVWERAMGLNDGTGAGDQGGGGDADGDGLTNAEERSAGTDPLDGSSVLAIFGLQQGGSSPAPVPASAYVADAGVGGPVTVRWQSVPGKAYRLESRVSLTDGDWVDVSGLIVADGSPTVFYDEAAAAEEHVFYRILVLPYP